jgi:DNA mismatch repair protein MutL
MTPAEYKAFTQAIQTAPQPKQETAAAAAAKLPTTPALPLREKVQLPQAAEKKPESLPEKPTAESPDSEKSRVPTDEPTASEPIQEVLPMPEEIPWRMVGELYNSYILVEQGDNTFIIDKHAAHERILFEKLKAHQEKISAQTLLTPIPVRLSPESKAELMANRDLLEELGFEVDDFGEDTLALRQIPMDLDQDQAAQTLETMAVDLLAGRREKKESVRDELLHTVACKAAIKAGWITSDAELLALVKQVMADESLNYCPHGRPICITLSKKQLEKQFKRT